jgi:hypothetical protein
MILTGTVFVASPGSQLCTVCFVLPFQDQNYESSRSFMFQFHGLTVVQGQTFMLPFRDQNCARPVSFMLPFEGDSCVLLDLYVAISRSRLRTHWLYVANPG